MQLWGENPHGQWKFQVVNTGGGSGKELINHILKFKFCFAFLAVLMSWKIVVHGTYDYPISFRSSSEANPSNVSRHKWFFFFSSTSSISTSHSIFIFVLFIFNCLYLKLF